MVKISALKSLIYLQGSYRKGEMKYSPICYFTPLMTTGPGLGQEPGLASPRLQLAPTG